MGRPKLAVGSTCHRGHLLSEGDIITRKHDQTCRICRNKRQRAVYAGAPVHSYHLNGHYRCGHPVSPENTTHRHCRTCHAALQKEKERTKKGYYVRQLKTQERNAAILTQWITGTQLRQIAVLHGVTYQRIAGIVKRAGGVTVRMRRQDLGLLAGVPHGVCSNYQNPSKIEEGRE